MAVANSKRTSARPDVLAVVRSCIGRRHRISKTEMEGIMLALAAAGLKLHNPYLNETWGAPYQAAIAWAAKCRGITCICIHGAGLRDGYVRYDQPGSMHPLQHAQVSFVPADIDVGRTDGGSSIAYLRRHADRVLLVTGEED